MKNNNQLEEYEIKEFCDYLQRIKNFKEKNHGEMIWFRGQLDSEWRLKPAILREARSVKDRFGKSYTSPQEVNFSNHNGDTVKMPSMTKMLAKFKEITRDSSDIISSANEVQLMEIAQHYGIPTLLLDWTTDPMVALFFAVGNIDLNNIDLNEKYASVWMINPLAINKVTFNDKEPLKILNSVNDCDEILQEIEVGSGTFCFEGTKNHPRICRQSGNFSYTCSKNIYLLDYTEACRKYICKINIPYSIVKELQNILELFDLSNDSIYYEKSKLDYISNDIKARLLEEFYKSF